MAVGETEPSDVVVVLVPLWIVSKASLALACLGIRCTLARKLAFDIRDSSSYSGGMNTACPSVLVGGRKASNDRKDGADHDVG